MHDGNLFGACLNKGVTPNKRDPAILRTQKSKAEHACGILLLQLNGA
jgi:hypothetical protein